MLTRLLFAFCASASLAAAARAADLAALYKAPPAKRATGRAGGRTDPKPRVNAALLKELRAEAGEAHIDVLAHSLGTRLLLQAMAHTRSASSGGNSLALRVMLSPKCAIRKSRVFSASRCVIA